MKKLINRISKPNETTSDNARPHPGPLPRGEGEPSAAAWKHSCCLGFVPRLGTLTKAETATAVSYANKIVTTLPLSSGERAGVRAGIITNCLIYVGSPLRSVARLADPFLTTSKRLRNKAQGCPVCGATLGKRRPSLQPRRGCGRSFTRSPSHNLFEVDNLLSWVPKVAQKRQPWALRHNLVEVERQKDRHSAAQVKTRTTNP